MKLIPNNEMKKFLNKHLFLYALIRIIQYRKDIGYLKAATLIDREFFYKRENTTIAINRGKTYYIISHKWKTNGFFAIMSKCLAGCAIADSMGFIPYVLVENSIFNIPGGYKGVNNMFENYFELTVHLKLELIKQQENYMYMNYSHIINLHRSFGLYDNNLLYSEYNINEDFLIYLSSILKKYFVIKPDLEKELMDEIGNTIPKSRVIAVHFRGTDFKLGRHGHPSYTSIDEYFKAVDKALENGFESVFLATDDENVVHLFLEKYKSRVYLFNDIERSSTECGVHFQKHERENDQFYLGREVLRDMLALANCDGLIAGISQVSLFARIQKYSYGKKYNYQYIIDNGLNITDSNRAKKYYNRLHKELKDHK